MSQTLNKFKDEFSTGEELMGVLACLSDLSEAALFVSRRMEESPAFNIHNQSTVLKMYGEEFLHLAESFRAKLIKYGDDVYWPETFTILSRQTNRFEIDEDLNPSSLLAALSSYANQQQRYLEGQDSWNIVGVKIVERAQMLAASLTNWALIAEVHSQAS